MEDAQLSLEDLADQVGIEKRTIRSYIQQGILRGPEGKGRYAHYNRNHLVRLKALRFLRQFEGRSLEEIRPRLLALSEAEVEDLAGRYDQLSTRQAGLVTGSGSAESALDYIHSLKLAQSPEPPPRQRRMLARAVSPAASALPAPPAMAREKRAGASATPIDEILAFFEGYSGGRTVPRRAKGEAWITIRVTPDFELRVRGVNSADQLARLERIADHLREALLGAGL